LRYAKKGDDKAGLGEELGFLRLRYKGPEGGASQLMETPLKKDAIKTLAGTDKEFRFAAAVAGYGQLLRGGKFTGTWNYANARQLALENVGTDRYGYRGEFLRLIDLSQALSTKSKP
jgi:Ca-activated chloride channel family protein